MIKKNKKIIAFVFFLFFVGIIFFVHKNVFASPAVGLKIDIIPGPQCYDGKDNDGDGKIDYPNDPDCDSANDNNESPIITNKPAGGGGGGFYSNNLEIVPAASVVFSGYAYPLNKVTLLKDGQIVSATIAKDDAKFNFSLSGLTPGDYNFSIFAQDKNGVTSDSFTFSLYVAKGASTYISGILIAPTITLDKTDVKQGENINIIGQSIPNSEVNISVHSENEQVLKVTSGKDGVYVYNLNTTPLEIGEHSAKSKIKINEGTSSFSKVLSFNVFKDVVLVNKDSGKKKIKCDFNNDKKTNLIDFSIMAFWYKKKSPPKMVDLNGDGTIDIIDFSILAFNWTG